MRNRLSFLFIFVVLNTQAQQQTYDVFTYTVPKNSTEATGKDYKAFSLAETGKGFLQIQIFRSIRTNSNDAFASEWKALTKESAIPNAEKSTPINGWNVVSGTGKRSNNGEAYTTFLYVFTNPEATADILINTNNNYWKPVIELFILSLKLQTYTSGTSTTMPANNSPKPDVYMYLSGGAVGFDASSGGLEYSMYNNQKEYILAYPDGTAYFKMPDDGLQKFSPSVSKSGNLSYYWGIFSHNGNTGNYRLQSQYDNKNAQLQKVRNTQWKVSGSAFLLYQCKSVDGLKLSGVWGNNKGKFDANQMKYYASVNCGPLIQFASDGSFHDFGIFQTQYDANCVTNSPNDRKGKGTYSISNFTLTLNYQDGHQKQLFLTGLFDNDPATNNEILCVRGNIWSKQ